MRLLYVDVWYLPCHVALRVQIASVLSRTGLRYRQRVERKPVCRKAADGHIITRFELHCWRPTNLGTYASFRLACYGSRYGAISSCGYNEF